MYMYMYVCVGGGGGGGDIEHYIQPNHAELAYIRQQSKHKTIIICWRQCHPV